ncbi:hypothetical protein [Sphingomonas cavernae]|uniref:DUF4410 domain-containing protein n=1 Tax=Sphingomonas cavernae TaxID=2320861 RepID=A0A418WS28_9SPHN|nr:hypothetical protein [Sphingomonas cavernae]RJF94062.1 hypothetical protein D3876_07310 [Sphingomonas cavernae]
MLKTIVALALAAIALPADAKQRRVVEPLPAAIVNNNHVVAVEVSISPLAQEKFAKFEAKAAEKRAEARLQPVALDTQFAARPGEDEYATLPFQKMFPLVMEDVTREWGLKGGQPIKLVVTIDTLKTANAAMAILLAPSADQLAGIVEVVDPATNASLGSFYVDVINSHSGWGGMLMRGGGVREKLAEEFSLESARILAGSTKKDLKARQKQREKEAKERAAAEGAATTGTR